MNTGIDAMRFREEVYFKMWISFMAMKSFILFNIMFWIVFCFYDARWMFSLYMDVLAPNLMWCCVDFCNELGVTWQDGRSSRISLSCKVSIALIDFSFPLITDNVSINSVLWISSTVTGSISAAVHAYRCTNMKEEIVKLKFTAEMVNQLSCVISGRPSV